ncbi:MAG: MarR family transcriptional regulator [Rhodopseudomonas sp.]|nr:MarR family transcriptional regulator [Rhodopseudomonas sp.]
MILRELHAMPGHLIRRAQQIAVSIFMEECGELDLTPVQYAALIAIGENEGIDATRLSALIAFDRSTLGSVLERLETRALISRYFMPDDKRIKRLKLTDSGQNLVARAGTAVRRAQERMLTHLPAKDRERFMELLEQFVELNNDVSRVPQRAAS